MITEVQIHRSSCLYCLQMSWQFHHFGESYQDTKFILQLAFLIRLIIDKADNLCLTVLYGVAKQSEFHAPLF